MSWVPHHRVPGVVTGTGVARVGGAHQGLQIGLGKEEQEQEQVEEDRDNEENRYKYEEHNTVNTFDGVKQTHFEKQTKTRCTNKADLASGRVARLGEAELLLRSEAPLYNLEVTYFALLHIYQRFCLQQSLSNIPTDMRSINLTKIVVTGKDFPNEFL